MFYSEFIWMLEVVGNVYVYVEVVNVVWVLYVLDIINVLIWMLLGCVLLSFNGFSGVGGLLVIV